MPNWWLQWAARIARILAEWWLRARSGEGAAPPEHHAEPDPDAQNQPASAPGADTYPC